PTTYVPGFFKIFDEILVNAADNKGEEPDLSAQQRKRYSSGDAQERRNHDPRTDL
nr:DNA topoisomerase 2 isoform X1 [Tanacetum cinerariifolium]